ncbi:MAG TPA: urease accessory protein UreD [Microlunatus sp.]|nr:urease accessory protein UreD [Microlunatus sp.]
MTPTTTRVSVQVNHGRHQVRTTAGLLRAQRVHGPPDRARVALVGQTALLLGGDEVRLDLEVGSGAHLELSDVAGTVAYHGRGRSASWHVTVRVGAGGRLRYRGEPLVISDGADVTRTLQVDLADGATARLRETVVFGRAGERGGRLDSSLLLRRDHREFSRERLRLDAESRARPGLLAGVRLVDSVLQLGPPPREGAGAGDLPISGYGSSSSERPDVTTYALLDSGSTITRFLGTSPAASPLR